MSLLHRLPWTEQAMQVLAKSKTHTQHHINHLNLTPCHTIRITKGGMRNMLSSIPGTSFYSCIFRAFGDWHPLRIPQDGAGRTWGISNETITWITGKGRQKQPQANSWISTHLVSSTWPMFIFCWLQMVTVYFLSSNTYVPTWSADFKSSQRHQPESKAEERNCASDNRHLCTKASNGSPLLSKWYEEQSSWVVGTSWYINKTINKYVYIYIEWEIKASCKAAS